jgi:phosphoribosylanthranilate isomerase
LSVGVFVNEDVERMLRTAERCRLSAVQLHGNEKESVVRRLQKNGFQVLKAVHVGAESTLKTAEDSPADALIFDTSVAGRSGGTGKIFDWGLLKGRKFHRPWFVSGGLSPRNVKKLLLSLSPYGVDVSSGVESVPGKKNASLVKEFIQNAKSAR